MKKICPIVESIKIIGTKPRLVIIRYLGTNELSFNQMKGTCDISSRTLALNLKFLMKQKIVGMKSVKNKNIYFLTKKGREILPMLDRIGKWGKKWKVC